MPQWRRFCEQVEVRLTRRDEAPVRAVEERGQSVAAQAVELVGRRFEHRERGDSEEHQQERGEKASGPSSPEPAEADTTVSRPLADEQRRDQETGKDEERVDAEEPAARPSRVEVIREHRENRERAEAIKGGLISEPLVFAHIPPRWAKPPPRRPHRLPPAGIHRRTRPRRLR